MKLTRSNVDVKPLGSAWSLRINRPYQASCDPQLKRTKSLPRQTAPGRYATDFDTPLPGSYHMELALKQNDKVVYRTIPLRKTTCNNVVASSLPEHSQN